MSTTPVADLIEAMFMQRVAAMKEKDESLKALHLRAVKETKVKIEAALKREPKAKLEAIEVPLPDWIPAESWNGYLEMRALKKRPMSPRAMQLALSTLQQFHSEGEDIGRVLDNSTVHGWIGLFRVAEEEKRSGEGGWV